MNWNDVLNYTKENPKPDRVVRKSEKEWRALLTPEQFRVTRLKGTESPFTGAYCETHSPGIYACVCCGTKLFDSSLKFESGTGWPSFTEPVKDNVIRYELDTSYGMRRIEVVCNVCEAHLGHVFPDGPPPSGLRFCINSASLIKVNKEAGEEPEVKWELATIGGGCFWCIEAILSEINGVERVVSGYAGGKTENPTYRQVCNGDTGHAEVVQVTFNPSLISYPDLLRIFMVMHNPTTRNRQGADVGSQYRSIILYHSDEQLAAAQAVISELEPVYGQPIVTELAPFTVFYQAEEHHQKYYERDPEKAYCQAVINPKLNKLRQYFSDRLKSVTI